MQELRLKVLKALKEQGFYTGQANKEFYKLLHRQARLRKLVEHREFLYEHLKVAKHYCRDGRDIKPEEIDLELREVKAGSLEEILFKWWNLAWWSLPYEQGVGRQLRFLLWDKTHSAPFGIIHLQSPILKISAINDYLNIPKESLDLWINRSMYATRLGALPPYNELLGGKMVALAVSCNEIRETYKRKYQDSKTLIKNRNIEPDLLFISTTSAFGKSSVYNRLKYKDELVAISVGYTKGYGTFHIPDDLYEELLDFLEQQGINAKRGFGTGPSRKLRLVSTALKKLGLENFIIHGIRREVYIFPLVKNLKAVIHNNEKPEWFDRPFAKLVDYWKERWAVPRAGRITRWQEFVAKDFFRKVLSEIERNEDNALYT